MNSLNINIKKIFITIRCFKLGMHKCLNNGIEGIMEWWNNGKKLPIADCKLWTADYYLWNYVLFQLKYFMLVTRLLIFSTFFHVLWYLLLAPTITHCATRSWTSMWKNPDTVVQLLFNHFCLWINDTWKFHLNIF